MIHKCNFGLFTKQKVLQTNNGLSTIVYANKKSHIAKLEDLLKPLLKNKLKTSPKKCQLFRKELWYMGNTIFIKHRRVYVKLLCRRLQAIHN